MFKKLYLFGILAAAVGLSSQNVYAATSDAVEELNELLRGEISAVETYRQALEKVGREPGSDGLRESLKNHESATEVIRKEIVRLGGKPTTDSGAWGVWAETVTGSAKIIGNTAALKALKEGEEHGMKEYTEILEDKDVAANFKTKIREEHLPQQRTHIAVLNKMIDAQS